jgi:FkbM family methyltransferase
MKRSGLRVKRFEDFKVYYRSDSSDERVLVEVIEKRTYRRPSIGFEVESGEHWLDIGANIGAFAIHCLLRGATVDCYEPDPECFKILKRNRVFGKMHCFNAAVSATKSTRVRFWSSTIDRNFYRGTLLERSRLMKEQPSVLNVHASLLPDTYDGIKMDIEGSEFGILDTKVLPMVEKLCFEYHTSRDSSMSNMKRRIKFLRSRYKKVSYCPEIDKIMAKGGNQKTFQDRVIYCIGLKKPPPN